MGLLELMGGDSSSGSGGGLDGFMSSPIAQILLPRISARFMENKKEQFLMQQIQRKQEFAAKFAQSIMKTDPMSAAAIMADPNNIDNVLSMYNSKNEWNRENTVTQQQKLAEETRKQAFETEKATWLPAPQQQYQKAEAGLINDAVKPQGVMANPAVEGPRPLGQLQQGETDINASPHKYDMLTKALQVKTGIPDLTPSEALSIAMDPGAEAAIKTARQTAKNNMLDAGGRTQVVMVNGVPTRMAQNPDTGKFDVKVGEEPKSADELTASAKTITIMDPSDNKPHVYSFNVDDQAYTDDQGVANVDPAGARDTKVIVQPDGSPHIMGWDPDKKTFSVDMGIATNAMGEAVRDADGNVIGYAKPKTGAGASGSVEERKGQALLTGIESSVDNIASTWGELSTTSNRVANFAQEAMGNSPTSVAVTGFLRSPGGRQARDSVTQIAQTYVYALSGQQAPDQEVARLMALVFPNASDDQDTINLKEARLADMINTVKVKAGVMDMSKMKDALINPKLRVQDPSGDTGLTLNKVSSVPMPASVKGHVSQEDWDNATPAARRAAIKAFPE